MHRALVGDLHQALVLIGVECAFNFDHPVDLVDLAFAGFAFGAILGVDLVVLQRHGDAIDGQRLEIGVHPHRHRGAGAERR